MTNDGLMSLFIEGTKRYGAVNHLGFTDSKLWNYSTVICEIDRENRRAKLNVRRYSTATSKIQGMLKYMLIRHGYSIEEVQGEPCNYWNNGYMGAPKWTPKEFKPPRESD